MLKNAENIIKVVLCRLSLLIILLNNMLICMLLALLSAVGRLICAVSGQLDNHKVGSHHLILAVNLQARIYREIQVSIQECFWY